MTSELISNQLQMQPTFRVRLPWDMEEAKQRIRRAIKTEALAAHAESAGAVIDFKIDPSEQRFWSPHLSVQLNRLEDPQSSEAFCRFSPRPEIWTLVMAVYLVAACCLFGAAIFAFVQWMMKQTPWALAAIPVALLAIIALHAASLVGQGWSRDQMQLLKSRWDLALEIARSEAEPPA